ncbi:MAG: hypothetical protein IPK16_08100 [Anaerolineales bacterium]|nr:hypothetical protein [Anaerolineales bacterium]
MIRKLMVPVFAALAMVMVMGTAAFAADAPVAQPSVAGQCVNFVDADGDGVCDNAGQQLGQGSGQPAVQGTGLGLNTNDAFVDADGDGVCDNLGTQVPLRDGTGSQNGASNAQRGGMGGRR